jgi:hypothetical protein
MSDSTGVQRSLCDARLLREVDASLLAQWRNKRMDYAADVVEALLRKIAELEANHG